MQITKFEQSGFIITAANGFKLGFDIGSYTMPLEKLDGVSVDAMLVSHLHGYHFSIPHIKKLETKKLYLNRECIELLGEETVSSEIVQVKVGDVVDIDTFQVTFFDVDHGPNVKIRPQENFGFLIQVDGQKIYFAGDMFYASGIEVSTLEVDYALIPVGGFYTFGPQEAADFVSTFKKIGTVIPMHYEKDQNAKTEFLKLH